MSMTGASLREALQSHSSGLMANAVGEESLYSKCAILADKYAMPVPAFINALEAYLIEAQKNSIMLEDMSRFEQALHKQTKSQQQQQQQQPAPRPILKPISNTPSSSSSSSSSSSYSSSPAVTSSTGKRPAIFTGNPTNNYSATPGTQSQNSANTQSPADAQAASSSSGPPGQAFKQRRERLQSVASMNSSLGSRMAEFPRSERGPLGMRCDISTHDSDMSNQTDRYRYMFTTLEERARNLDRHLLRMQAFMCEKANLQPEDLQPVGVPSPEVVWVCGRICCESETGRINNQAVLLEGSRRDSGGRRVKLELQELNAYSLFPGQIVLIEGINSGGRKMVVKSIVEGFPPDQPKTEPKKLLEFHHTQIYQGSEPINIMCASGPFTTSDSLDYEPLMTLVARVIKNKPDVLVLTGPFVDCSQPLLHSGDVELYDFDDNGNRAGSHGASYEMVFIERIVRDGLLTLFSTENGGDENIPTNIILVPSLLDAHHECVYPQPPFGDRAEVKTPFFSESLGVLNIPYSKDVDERGEVDHRRRVHLMPNPCMFRVNEVLFGVTSQDVLFALSKDEVSHNIPGNRLDRLVAHLLQQQSFSPQFPAPESCLAQVRSVSRQYSPAPLPSPPFPLPPINIT